MAIDGTYKTEVTMAGVTNPGTAEFTTDGDTITGFVADAQGTKTVMENGTINGNDYTFILNAGGAQIKVTGSVDGDEITGVLDGGALMQGSVKGTRV